MRALSAFLLLSLLFLFSNFINARNYPADYWKSTMKGEPMPKAIDELVRGDKAFDTTNMDRFNKAFDTRPNHILHPSHIVKDFKLGHRTDSDQGEMIQSSVKIVRPQIKVPEYNKAQKERIYMSYL